VEPSRASPNSPLRHSFSCEVDQIISTILCAHSPTACHESQGTGKHSNHRSPKTTFMGPQAANDSPVVSAEPNPFSYASAGWNTLLPGASAVLQPCDSRPPLFSLEPPSKKSLRGYFTDIRTNMQPVKVMEALHQNGFHWVHNPRFVTRKRVLFGLPSDHDQGRQRHRLGQTGRTRRVGSGG
jgi:hypothetical protein